MGLRFRYRHVHATMYQHIRSQMVALGWGDSSLPSGDPLNAAINFNVRPMTYRDFQPDESGQVIAPMTLAITFGDEPASEDLELGAGLAEIAYEFFIDVWAEESQAVATAVTSDLKDVLEDLVIPVKDFMQVPPAVTTELIEIDHDDVSSVRPSLSVGAQDFKKFWRTMTATARVHYLR